MFAIYRLSHCAEHSVTININTRYYNSPQPPPARMDAVCKGTPLSPPPSRLTEDTTYLVDAGSLPTRQQIVSALIISSTSLQLKPVMFIYARVHAPTFQGPTSGLMTGGCTHDKALNLRWHISRQVLAPRMMPEKTRRDTRVDYTIL